VWKLIAGLGPLTRAELARALSVTRRTASQAATALQRADLATLRPGDHALASKTAPWASGGALRDQRNRAVGHADAFRGAGPAAQQLAAKREASSSLANETALPAPGSRSGPRRT